MRWITGLQQAIKQEITKDCPKDPGEPQKLHWDDSDTEENDISSSGGGGGGGKRRGLKPSARQILLIHGK